MTEEELTTDNETDETDDDTLTASDIYERALAEMDETYELIDVDYRDKLTSEEVDALVAGKMENIWESRWEWESDQRHDGARYIVDNKLGLTSEELEILQNGSEYDELLYEVEDRDISPWMDWLIRNTPAPLLRIACIDEDAAFSFEPVTPEQVLDAVGFEHTSHNVAVVARTLAECSPEFSVLMGYWLAVVDLEILAGCPEDGSIRIHNPILYLGNPFVGSGYFDTNLEGDVVVKRADIRTDRGAFGYSVDEVFGLAGVSFAEVDAEIMQETTE